MFFWDLCLSNDELEFLVLIKKMGEISETEKGIFDAVLEGYIDFESDPWPSISMSAKDLVRRMLTQDPKRRITSAQVLGTYLCNTSHVSVISFFT